MTGEEMKRGEGVRKNNEGMRRRWGEGELRRKKERDVVAERKQPRTAGLGVPRTAKALPRRRMGRERWRGMEESWRAALRVPADRRRHGRYCGCGTCKRRPFLSGSITHGGRLRASQAAIRKRTRRDPARPAA